jgi:hypothetical protein
MSNLFWLESVPLKEYNKNARISFFRRSRMEYLTTTETAEKWNLTRRRVTQYCTEGRIKGAIHKGNLWLIPSDAEKPEDPRRNRK